MRKWHVLMNKSKFNLMRINKDIPFLVKTTNKQISKQMITNDLWLFTTNVSIGNLVTKFSAQRDLFAPEGQRTGNKRQRREAEEQGEEEGNKGEGEGYLSVGEVLTRLSLDREETGVTHRPVSAYKGKRSNPVLE